MLQEIVVQLVTCMSQLSLLGVPGKVGFAIPGQYSKTSQTKVSVTITSYNRAMWGWTNWRWW